MTKAEFRKLFLRALNAAAINAEEKLKKSIPRREEGGGDTDRPCFTFRRIQSN